MWTPYAETNIGYGSAKSNATNSLCCPINTPHNLDVSKSHKEI